MKTQKLKFEDFATEKLSKKQQKTVRGGDDEPIEPTKGNGNGNGSH